MNNTPIKLYKQDIAYLLKIVDICAGEGFCWEGIEEPTDYLTRLWGDDMDYSIDNFIERIEV